MAKEKYIYVVVTRTNTVPSKVIRLCTRARFNHVSLTFDERLEDLVSFGRLYPSMPMPGGFVHEGRKKGFFLRFRDTTSCRIYAKKVSELEYQRFHTLLDRFEQHRFKFNNLGLLTLMVGIPLERENAYFCSQFCGEMLQNSGIYSFHKPFGLLRPIDFCYLDGFTLLYEGMLDQFDSRQCAMIA